MHRVAIQTEKGRAMVHYKQIGKGREPIVEEPKEDDSPPPYIIHGGYRRDGKVLYQCISKGAITESIEDATPPMPKRNVSPPPIHGPPGRMEFSDSSDDESKILQKLVKRL